MFKYDFFFLKKILIHVFYVLEVRKGRR